MKRFVLLFAGAAMYIAGNNYAAYAAAAPCTSLTQTLVYGDAGSQVLALQNYLYAIGFMSALPNGHFGPSTRAAVKQFQSTHGINAIGTAGPLTRAAITKASCSYSLSSTSSTPTQPIASTTPPQTISPVSSSLVTAPRAGETLTIGKTYSIAWTGSANSMGYTILLENTGGVGAGYIAMGTFPDNTFVWKIGTILSSNTAIAPGTYRIRITDTIRGPQSIDRVSDPFIVSATPVSIRTVFPSTVPADNNTSVVLYGSGFTSGTAVYFDGLIGSSAAQVTYASPDGRVLIFTVPTSISTGRHTFQAISQYTSSATTTISETAFITITPPVNN